MDGCVASTLISALVEKMQTDSVEIEPGNYLPTSLSPNSAKGYCSVDGLDADKRPCSVLLSKIGSSQHK